MSEPSKAKVYPIAGGVAGQAPKSDRFWDDEDFQDQLVALLVHDPLVLKSCSLLLDPDDFKPLHGIHNGRERWIVAERALEFYEKHQEPLGRLVRADVLEYASLLNLGANQVSDLKKYIKHSSELRTIAPDSISEKVIRYKSQRIKASTLQELNDLQATGQLTDEKWKELTEAPLRATRAQETESTQPQWPEPLKPDAFHGLAGDIVRAIEPHSEADPAALLLQTLVSFGNVVGREPHWMHGATRHALNLFVGIVGPTGTGKGSGLDQVTDLFRDVDPMWSTNPNTYAGLSSGEGLIHMVRDPVSKMNEDGEQVVTDPGVKDKRLLLIQPEFAQVLEVLERAGNTLATKLRNCWDGKPLKNNSLSSPLTATDAHISLIVHSTQDDLRDLMSRTMILNGFGNRILWTCSRRSKALPFGGMVSAREREALVERLVQALAFAETRGRMFFEKHVDVDYQRPAASNLWVSAYRKTLTRDAENPLTGRAAPQTRRLAHVYALMDSSERVRAEHLQAALEVWRYCADSARFIFGGVRKADKLLEALRKRGRQGLTRKEIYADVFGGNKGAEEITRALGSLQKQGSVRVQAERPAGGRAGRPVERWFAV